MKFTIEIDCSNAAFEDNPEYEAGRIIEDLGSKLRRGTMSLTYYAQGSAFTLRDLDGHKVGEMRVSE